VAARRSVCMRQADEQSSAVRSAGVTCCWGRMFRLRADSWPCSA
jgi:hypothetical protein